MATAHVPQHAFGAAYYALKAVAAAHSAKAEVKIAMELSWQSRRLPKNLRQGWQDFLNVVEELKWKEEQELEAEIKENKLVVKKT